MARCSEQADYIPLDEQDRTLWDRTLIERGNHLLKAALDKGELGPYQLQAAISGVHARARHFADTHWLEISLLYQKLYALNPSPVIKLNEIVALSFLNGPEFALKALAELQQQSDALTGYQPFYAAQADFLRRSKQLDGAKAAYQQAINFSANTAEQKFLRRRLQGLD
jgi:RNA polymerase sigma-70 factor (ECF subfamily)